MSTWAVITGGGTGIGAALAKHFASKNLTVLITGRRLEPLQAVKRAHPDKIKIISADIGREDGIDALISAIPPDASVKYVVQNAAVGDPAFLENLDRHHFEYAYSVNVTAPLFITQKLLPKLKLSNGRILHIGTSVGNYAQRGTATYGITKLAFYRLYEQLKVDLAGTGVSIASARPGIVDTEGLWDHYKLAKSLNLPHTSYFDQAKESGEMLDADFVAHFLSFVLMETDDKEFSEKEWSISDQSHWARWKPCSAQ